MDEKWTLYYLIFYMSEPKEMDINMLESDRRKMCEEMEF